jgi:hypothetical protein
MKKTPRDLLLSRHAAATPQLDQLRRKTLDDVTPIPARQLLHALFFPQRRLWLGLAVAWLFIVVVNFTQRSADPRPSSKFATPSYAVNWSTNQAQLHALLTETRSYH